MTVFALNAENLNGTSYRLQGDNSWVKCPEPRQLHLHDFRSGNRDSILGLQIPDTWIHVGDNSFVINPSIGLNFLDTKSFHYAVYCFRDSFPEHPQQPQMEEILLAGNDRLDNVLVLSVEGLFSLQRLESIVRVDPFIVCQFECYLAGNGYVGPAIQTDDFDNCMLELFEKAMNCWKVHLIEKVTHLQFDEVEPGEIESVLDIFSELERHHKVFNPDF